jgi:hypothetical protein
MEESMKLQIITMTKKEAYHRFLHEKCDSIKLLLYENGAEVFNVYVNGVKSLFRWSDEDNQFIEHTDSGNPVISGFINIDFSSIASKGYLERECEERRLENEFYKLMS